MKVNPITTFRNFDIRKVAGILGAATMVETAIISGTVVLDGPGSPIPTNWHDGIVWWCKLFLFLNGAVGTTHATTALPWEPPKP